jgi:outer membrane immunogenic protein
MLAKKFLVMSIAAAAILGAPALAADMPVKAPAAASAFDWSGLYVGGNFGLGWARSQEGVDPPIFGGLIVQSGNPCGIVGVGVTSGKDCVHPLHGFIGGGQGGYNWQRGNWVFGLEASFSASEIAGTELVSIPAGTNSYETRIRSLLLAEGRLGYALDRTLYYTKAGYAGGSVRANIVGVAGGPSEAVTAWHNGWTVGAGIEYAFAPNWIFGVEYDFADLGNQRRTGLSTSGVAMPISVDVKELHLALLRLSYKFGSR